MQGDMKLILTHNNEPTKPLPAMPRRLLNSVESVLLGGMRVGMVTSRSEGGRQGEKYRLKLPQPARPLIAATELAHRLGVYDRTTFYSLPRWQRGGLEVSSSSITPRLGACPCPTPRVSTHATFGWPRPRLPSSCARQPCPRRDGPTTRWWGIREPRYPGPTPG